MVQQCMEAEDWKSRWSEDGGHIALVTSDEPCRAVSHDRTVDQKQPARALPVRAPPLAGRPAKVLQVQCLLRRMFGPIKAVSRGPCPMHHLWTPISPRQLQLQDAPRAARLQEIILPDLIALQHNPNSNL